MLTLPPYRGTRYGYETSCRTGGRRTWLLVATALLLVAASQARVVKVAVYQNPPKVFSDSGGRAQGIFIDLISAMAEKEGWQLEYVTGTWDEGLARLEHGEVDLVPDVAWSAAREERYSLNRITVIPDWFEIWTRRGLSLDNLTDLAGKRVAVLKGSIQDKVMRQYSTDLDLRLEFVEVDSLLAVLEALHRNEADAGVVNRFFGSVPHPGLQVESSRLILHPTRLLFAAAKGRNQDLIDGIDRQLTILKDDRESVYYRSLGQWLMGGENARLPVWILYGFAGIAVVLVWLGGTAWLLRAQVRRRTRDLEWTNQQLVQAMESLKEAQEDAMKRERLHAMGTMASGIAHDFNNALTPILGYVDLLAIKPAILSDPERCQAIMETIRTAAQDAQKIVERMRAFYKERGHSEPTAPVNLAEIVRQALELSRPRWENQALERGVKIEVIPDTAEVPLIDGRPTELREVVLNLIFNAVDAMTADGTITLSTRLDRGHVRLEVRDTGSGMTPEVIARCLTPFFTTKGEFGTGMGLAMVKSVVEEHGGELRLKSAPGEGTTVILSFPISQRDATATDTAESVQGPEQLRILAVDDDLRSLTTIAELLEVDGHVVETRTDPIAALNLAERRPFDLLITDHVMPSMLGTKLIETIRVTHPSLPALMISGSTETIPQESEIGKGPFQLINKPATLGQIREALRNLLHHGGRRS